jgi:hypothetical protein
MKLRTIATRIRDVLNLRFVVHHELHSLDTLEPVVRSGRHAPVETFKCWRTEVYDHGNCIGTFGFGHDRQFVRFKNVFDHLNQMVRR